MNLYVVATPIGNLEDITLRAIRVILESKLIIAESTSKAGILLSYFKGRVPDINSQNISPKIISLTEDEEEFKIPQIIELLKTTDGCLISEAGTPLVSDPGFKFVREAIKHGVNIIPIPGPSAAITALVASGLPTDNFIFTGFLSKSSVKKEKALIALKNSEFKTTVIAFESAERIEETLSIILRVLGNVDIVIARELTKIHEEFIRKNASEALEIVKAKKLKGEITLLFRTS